MNKLILFNGQWSSGVFFPLVKTHFKSAAMWTYCVIVYDEPLIPAHRS